MASRTRLRLGIDLDGVVADFNTGWTARYNAEFGTALTVDDVAVWDAPVALTHFENMSQFWRWARRAGGSSSLFRILQPYPGAIESLRRLAKRDHIAIVTTKPSYAVHDTFAWLAEHRVPSTEVHIVDDKTSVACDVYLDDADHNVSALVRAHPAALVCRFVQPWARPHDGAVDVHNFDEFSEHVEAFRSSGAQSLPTKTC